MRVKQAAPRAAPTVSGTVHRVLPIDELAYHRIRMGHRAASPATQHGETQLCVTATETEKAPVSLEISAADLLEIRKAVDAAATADGSSYRLRRIGEDLRRVLREVAEQIQRQGRDMENAVTGGDQ